MAFRSLAGLGLAALLSACVGSPGKLPLPAPTLVSSTPADGATVGSGATLALTFSEPMDASSVVVAVTDGTDAYDPGAPTWSNGGATVTYAAPPSPLAHEATYGVTVDGEGKGGNAMQQASFVFSVEAAPVVETVEPAAGATAVAAAYEPTITFNVPADHASTQIVVKEGSTEVTCLPLWSADSKQLTCHHTAPLAFSTPHTIDLAPGARSAGGDAVDASGELPSAFTTAADILPPTAARDASGDVATDNVTRNASIVIAFDQPVNQLEAQAALSFTPSIAGSFGPWDATGTRMTWVPAAALPYGGQYQWNLLSGIHESTGTKASATAYSGTFKVVKQGTASPALVNDATGYVVMSGHCTDGDASAATYVGDTGGTGADANQAVLTFYTFDGAPLAATAAYVNPTAATLSMTQTNTAYQNPGALGALYAQSVKFGGVVCDPSDLTARASVPTDHSAFFFCHQLCCPIHYLCSYDYYQTTLSTSWGLGTTQAADVGATVSHQWADRAGRANRIQFRLAFATAGVDYTTYTSNNDGVQDLFQIWLPSLSVTYDYSW
jgi:methionine-rich copper-binding protein CopC